MPPRSFSTIVVRPEDFLILVLEFREVEFDPPTGDDPGEVRGGSAAHLIVHFQPQHIAEQAFFQAGEPALPGNETPLRPGAVGSRLAGPSRLVFRVPASERIPYTLDGILGAVTRLPQSVAPVSSYDPPVTGCLPLDPLLRLFLPLPPRVTAPASTHTALEAPYRLMLSPDGFARWSHAITPLERNGRTELWHTRLGSHRSGGDPRVRAIWSPDFREDLLQPHYNPSTPTTNDDPFRHSLDSRDRNEIVHLTSNYHISGFLPRALRTERLMLSSLGAWLEVEGDWDPPVLPVGPLTVEEWRHDAAMARDQYVRVVYAGYLFPFGHRASLVKITERKFALDQHRQTPGYVAYLFQRMFLIVRERERSYAHRAMPFRRVTILTRITPDLAEPSGSQVGTHGQSAFWPRVSTPAGIVDFRFQLAGVDWEGRSSHFTSPLLFVDRTVEGGPALAEVFAHFNSISLSSDRRRRVLAGQPIAFAPAQKPRDTTLEATAVSLGAESRPTERPRFRPTMARGEVAIPAVQQLTGSLLASHIEWEPTYLSGSGSSIGNAGQVFVRVQGSPLLRFGSTEKTGGLVAPDIHISGISRAVGPVGGDVAQMASGSFNPLDVFGDVKLLGGIKLGEIIKNMVFSNVAGALGKVPGLTTVRDGDVIRTRYDWRVSRAELVDGHGLFTPHPTAAFTLEAVVEKRLEATTPPIFTATGTLTEFTVTLVPAARLVEIDFQSVTFRAVPDKKVDVSVQLRGVRFLGILEFVNELRSFIPLDGFNDPPQLDLVTVPNPGLNLGYTLGIPTIGIGIMTLQNVSLSAGFFLPFGNAPLNFHFAFCQRHQPFILTVSLFGGGGFFSMDVGVHSVVMVEAALEFGASIALNLGVASGQASIMAGFYFQKAGADFALTGYFRAAGSLSVLGIITVSLEFYLGLSYASKGITPHGGALWGQAKLTVKIEILFFSTSVSIKMEREFAGSDPTFRQLVSPDAWAEYCDAFAAYA